MKKLDNSEKVMLEVGAGYGLAFLYCVIDNFCYNKKMIKMGKYPAFIKSEVYLFLEKIISKAFLEKSLEEHDFIDNQKLNEEIEEHKKELKDIMDKICFNAIKYSEDPRIFLSRIKQLIENPNNPEYIEYFVRQTKILEENMDREQQLKYYNYVKKENENVFLKNKIEELHRDYKEKCKELESIIEYFDKEEAE